MNRRRAVTVFEMVPQLVIIIILAAILFPVFDRARHNARRATCQTNLKQLSLAFLYYAQDYNDRLPQRSWAKSLTPYTKTQSVFNCPETYEKKGTTDYFWNARFFGREVSKIKSPSTLILGGDGLDNAPFNASLTQIPTAWLQGESSPAWRHLEKADYMFADGHVKSFKATTIDTNFRIGSP